MWPFPLHSRHQEEAAILQALQFHGHIPNNIKALELTGPILQNRYKEKNKDEASTAEKIQDLSDFIKTAKFGMMTTKAPSSDLLVSRAMAVAAQVHNSSFLSHHRTFHTNTPSTLRARVAAICPSNGPSLAPLPTAKPNHSLPPTARPHRTSTLTFHTTCI